MKLKKSLNDIFWQNLFAECVHYTSLHVRLCRCVCLMQQIDGIPDDIKRLYKTVWEISQKTIIKMAADRGPYIDQSQSLNIHFAEPDKKKLDSAHFYAWKMVRLY